MKIKNFIKGNYTYMPDVIDKSGTVYYGKITMNYDEYRKAVKYLVRARIGYSYNWEFNKRLLLEDLERKASVKGNGFILAIRVPATEKLVEKFKLDRYKKQNYYLEVMPK